MNKTLNSEDKLTLRRLRFRSSHRGCKETDLVLGSFADQALEGLNAQELAAYAAFLEEDDAHIWDWLVGRRPPPRADYEPLLQRMRTYCPEG
jgi:antitoxin CptB